MPRRPISRPSSSARTLRAADPLFEKALHRLPEPGPVRTDEPFVGNETQDENLDEAVRVALWKATDGCCEVIGAEIFGGHVVLSGTAASKDEALRCEAAVAGIEGVASVQNLLAWDPPASDSDPAPASG